MFQLLSILPTHNTSFLSSFLPYELSFRPQTMKDFPTSGLCPCYSFCQEHSSFQLSYPWLLLGIQSQLRCHLPKEVTIHSIKIALHPPKSSCHFSPSYCLGPFSPWLLLLPKLVSFIYLSTLASPGFHQ